MQALGWLSASVTLFLLAGAPAPIAQSRETDSFSEQRRNMVESQLRERGIAQPELLDAMLAVPRHRFVPEELQEQAYQDGSLPIGWGEFISEPYLSARMIELLALKGGERVLEIGTGSGYDAAVLAQIAAEVYTVEITPVLAERAGATFETLGYGNIRVRTGDGYEGWDEYAPFDAIILTAAPPSVPDALLEQLEVSGRMVVPVGRFLQELMVITKLPDGSQTRTVMPVRLGPMRQPPPP